MRIALVVERFEPTGGGVEQAAWNVAHALADSGDDVTVLARAGRLQPPTSQPRVEGLRVPRYWQPLRVRRFSQRAESHLRGADPAYDVIQSFCRTRHQHIYRAGGGTHAEYMQRTYGAGGAAWRRISPRHHTQLSAEASIFADPRQWVHCVSAMVRDEILRRYAVDPRRLVVIHNGVDCERYRPAAPGDESAARLRAAQGAADPATTVWLFAGSGARRKGLDLALRALALCDDAGARLWVAGRDASAAGAALAQRHGVAHRVRFLGPRSDMEVVYRAADALLHPARYDPFANVCLEAAASGIPSVTSRRNGAAEVVAPAGIVVDDPEDVAALAAAMSRLARRERRDVLGRRAREIAMQNGWPRHVDRLRALYRRVAEAGRQP